MDRLVLCLGIYSFEDLLNHNFQKGSMWYLYYSDYNHYMRESDLYQFLFLPKFFRSVDSSAGALGIMEFFFGQSKDNFFILVGCSWKHLQGQPVSICILFSSDLEHWMKRIYKKQRYLFDNFRNKKNVFEKLIIYTIVVLWIPIDFLKSIYKK